VADLLVLTPDEGGVHDTLPALALLGHRVRSVAPEPAAMVQASDADVLVVDARGDLIAARTTCRLVQATGISVPLLVVVTEGGMSVVGADWGVDDVILASAGPAEIDARIRLLVGRAEQKDPTHAASEFSTGELTVDTGGYTARLRGKPLDLTYKEFELLKYLMQHPGRVYTRDQLLQEVWGFDYYGGTRTVDVHVRRLRAKLGSEYEHLIGTVRNVGYRFEALAQMPSRSS